MIFCPIVFDYAKTDWIFYMLQKIAFSREAIHPAKCEWRTKPNSLKLSLSSTNVRFLLMLSRN